MFLSRIPERYFEMAGTFFGLFASVSILTQIIAELRTDGPSTLSPLYAIGFLLCFLFWMLYGFRFNRTALWLTNGIGFVMQGLLLVLILAT